MSRRTALDIKKKILEILKKEARGEKIFWENDTLVIFDSQNGAIYQVDPQSKKGEILAASQDLAGASQMGLCDQKAYVFSHDRESGCRPCGNL